MTVTTSGTWTPNKTLSGKDGADITTAEYNSESWWRNASNWDTVSGSAWDFDNIWEWDDNINLPVLRNVGVMPLSVSPSMAEIAMFSFDDYDEPETSRNDSNPVTSTVERFSGSESASGTFNIEYPSGKINTSGNNITISVPKDTKIVVINGKLSSGQSAVVNQTGVVVKAAGQGYTFTVDTRKLASGGKVEFTITVSEPGKADITYMVTIGT
jgi:hypothetical protein